MDENESLLEAIQNRATEAVELLLKRGADLNAVGTNGYTPLHMAVEKGYLEIVRILLSEGANVNATVKRSPPPDVETRRQEIVRIILESADRYRETPLHIAVEKGYAEIVRILLTNAANVNAEDQYMRTPLHMAVIKGYPEIVRILLSYEADVDALDRDEETPLYTAVEKGDLEIVKILVAKGADVNIDNCVGCPILHSAVFDGYHEIVKFLLSNGADVNLLDDMGTTPLTIAFQRGYRKIIKILLSNGADVNPEAEYDYYDPPPLHMAVEKGYQEIIKIILSKGASLTAKDESGATPLDIAFKKGNQDFLLECQAEITNMKIEKINTANISFHDILTKTISCLAIYMRNENIVAVLKSENYASKFPNYCSMIKLNFRKGMERKKLLDQANQIFSSFITNFYCSDKISSYLSNQDIRILIDAFKPLTISRRPNKIKKSTALNIKKNEKKRNMKQLQ